LTLSPAGGSPVTGGLSADGNTLVTSQTTAGVLPEILVGIKQGQTDFSNANLTGSYAVAAFGYDSTADISGLSNMAFDGTGNFAATGVQNQGATVSSSAALGTYLVAADGTLTVTPMDSDPVTGGLGADGTTLVITQMTAAHLPQVLLGVESALPALTHASIKILCVEMPASTRAFYMCPQAVETLKNTGTSTLNLFAISIAGQFAQTGNCGPSLSPGQTCTITVRYSGPTNITAPNLQKDTTYSGSLSVEAGISAAPETAVTQKVPLQAVLPKASG
jgi:hypothetical protein